MCMTYSCALPGTTIELVVVHEIGHLLGSRVF